MNTTVWNIINYLFFSALWLGLIKYSHLFVLPALIYVIFFIAVHIHKYEVATVIVSVSVLGFLMDICFVSLHVINFTGALLIPLWFFCLWPLFATCLCSTLKPILSLHWLLQSGFALIASYLAYAVGDALNEQVHIHNLIVIAGGWAILFPILCQITKRVLGQKRDLIF